MKKKGILVVAAALLCTGVLAITASNGVMGTGIKVRASGDIVEDTVNLSEFKELRFLISSINGYVEAGDSYKLEYHVRKINVPEVKQDGDKLVIEQPSQFGIDFGSWFEDSEEYYKLTVPKDAGLFEADIEATSGILSVKDIEINGDVKISSGEMDLENIKGEELLISSTSGDITIDDIEVDSLQCKLTSGNLKVKKCTTDKFEVRLSSGNVNLDETKFSSAYFKLTSGNVKANIIGSEKDYSYDLNATSGDIKVGENEYDDEYTSGDDKNHMIKAELTSGNLTLSFSK